MMHNIEWFKQRIWTRIYRKASSCKCKTCADVTKNWLIIADENHAWYLDMCQEMHEYFDKPL